MLVVAWFMTMPSNAFSSVCKVPDGRRNDLKGAVGNLALPADLEHDCEKTVLHIEGESRFVQDVATAGLVSDASNQGGIHWKLPLVSWRQDWCPTGLPQRSPKLVFHALASGFPPVFNSFNSVAEQCCVSKAINDLSLVRQHGIAVAVELPLCLGWLRQAESPHCVRIKIIKVSEYQRCLNGDGGSGRVTKIGQFILGEDRDSCPDWKLLNGRDRQIMYRQPSTLGCLHLAELPLHRLGLVLHGGDLGGERPVPALASRAHLAQLILSSFGLCPSSFGGLVSVARAETGADGDDRRQEYGSEPIPPLLAAMMFLLGVPALLVSWFRGPNWLLPMGWLGIVIGAIEFILWLFPPP